MIASLRNGVRRVETHVAAADASDDNQLAVTLASGLELLAADPALARLLLVESSVAEGQLRLEHERSLARLAEALRQVPAAGGRAPSPEMARSLAGGLVSHLSGRVLAGEAEELLDSLDLLLDYLRAPSSMDATAPIAVG